MSPYLPPRIYDLEQFRKDINVLAQVLHLDDHVKFVGGEPFLVPNFAEYVQVLRASGITPTIPVITNGTALLSASEEALTAPDCVNVSYYADSPPPILDRIHQGIERLRNVRNNRWIDVSNPRTEFFTSEIDYRIDDPQIVQRIWNECWQKNSCNSLADGYVSRCTTGSRKQRYLQAIGRPVELLHCRCPIHEPDLEERLRAYLSSPEIPGILLLLPGLLR